MNDVPVDSAPLDALGCAVKVSSDSLDKPGAAIDEGASAYYDSI